MMATLAEPRKDEQQKVKESNNTLNSSKADCHISTQESLNENNRDPKTLVQKTAIDGGRSHLVQISSAEISKNLM